MPMTKERRTEIEKTFHSPASLFAELLAEVDFWKNAVKNSPEFCSDSCAETDDAHCDKCDNSAYEDKGHKPDCAWKLAQE